MEKTKIERLAASILFQLDCAALINIPGETVDESRKNIEAGKELICGILRQYIAE